MWPADRGVPEELDATTITSGTSHRSIEPSPLSSVMFATSGDTMLNTSPPGPVQLHCSSGSKLLGGAVSVHMPTPLVSSWTLHLSTTASTPSSAPPSPLFGRLPGPHAV